MLAGEPGVTRRAARRRSRHEVRRPARAYFSALLDAQVAAAFDSACAPPRRGRSDSGGRHDPARPGDIAPVYLHIVLAEAAAYHAKTLESRPDDYTPNVRVRLEMGRYILAEDYVRALRGREVLTREVDEALDGRDALLLPSLPIARPKLGAHDRQARRLRGTCAQRHASTDTALQHHRASGDHASLGATTGGLPIGVQLVGLATGPGRSSASLTRRSRTSVPARRSEVSG